VPWGKRPSISFTLFDTTKGQKAGPRQPIKFSGTVSVSGGVKSNTVYTDINGNAVAIGLPLPNAMRGVIYQAQFDGSTIYNPTKPLKRSYNVLNHPTYLTLVHSPTKFGPSSLIYDLSGRLMDLTKRMGVQAA